jgi:hypothetical protein
MAAVYLPRLVSPFHDMQCARAGSDNRHPAGAADHVPAADRYWDAPMLGKPDRCRDRGRLCAAIRDKGQREGGRTRTCGGNGATSRGCRGIAAARGGKHAEANGHGDDRRPSNHADWTHHDGRRFLQPQPAESPIGAVPLESTSDRPSRSKLSLLGELYW